MNGMHMEGQLGKRHRSEDMGSHADGAHPPRKRKDFEPMPPNHILLFTVMNPLYPITVEIVHTICSSHARVVRIVIFQKNGVQAMVEFESVDAACAVKDSLNGADIYSGCCTLKIDFAKPTRLNVNRNDTRSWDYTLPSHSQEMETAVKKAPLLPEPPAMGGGGYPSPMGGGGGYADSRRSGADSMRGGSTLAATDRYGAAAADRYGGADRYGAGGASDRAYLGGGGQDYGRGDGGYGQDAYGAAGRSLGGGGRRADDRVGSAMVGGVGGPQQGSVLMVYDVDKNRMNPERLFNMFCQYGNVIRIKFMKTKEGCAMLQMEDALAVERAIGNLNSLEFFGCRMQLSHSKQPYLNEVQQPHQLPDGSNSYADYSRNRNNRFLDPTKASKNRIQGPSRILHFYNMPLGMNDDDIKELFTSRELTPPETIKMFPVKSERSCSGLLEFATVSEAVEALVVCNHVSVQHSSSKFPYTVKLCFSSTREGRGGPRGDVASGGGVAAAGGGRSGGDRGRGDDGGEYY